MIIEETEITIKKLNFKIRKCLHICFERDIVKTLSISKKCTLSVF